MCVGGVGPWQPHCLLCHVEASGATLDLFFDLATERPAPSTLLLKLPEAFPHPESCDAVPLTPWLRLDEVSCAVNGTEVFVHFAAYLGAGAALSLRLAPFPLPVDFDAVRPGSASWLNPVEPRSLNVRLESVGPGGYTDACHPADGALVPETASSKGLKEGGIRTESLSLAEADGLNKKDWALELKGELIECAANSGIQRPWLEGFTS
eukprot:s3325_g3.t1